jgi:hypothetical protein
MRSEQIFTTLVTANTPAASTSGFIPTNYETRTVQVTIDPALTSATVVIAGSNDGIGKVALGSFALTSAANSDGLVLNAPVNWKYVVATITASVGTGNVYVTTTSAEAFKA